MTRTRIPDPPGEDWSQLPAWTRSWLRKAMRGRCPQCGKKTQRKGSRCDRCRRKNNAAAKRYRKRQRSLDA